MSALDDKPFPRTPLIAAILLVVASLVVVGGSRAGLLGSPANRASAETAVTATATADLRFEDQVDGGVIVTAVGGRTQVIPPATGGFVRGVVRGMVRDRKSRGIGQEPVFRLTEWSDGRLTLEDTATRRSFNLNAFGPDNRQAFETMLQDARGTT
ncbi:photosynthetic complex assembly protein PuhC [Brevundimonas sp. TWP2-3-4b2]|uniref:photosynthetic complex assembly protein PuhC n=1 Tax=Brevundimonas sp. TWP2-3-4b2 TaxID=2804595 RepID=UPI003CE8B4DE